MLFTDGNRAWENKADGPMPFTAALVAQRATALVCRFDPAPCDQVRASTILFKDLDPTMTGYVMTRDEQAPIILNVRFLAAPPDETAAVLVHEATHQRDRPSLALYSPRDFCYFTETNALTQQARFWNWAHPYGIFPGRDRFDRAMRALATGPVSARSVPEYRHWCG